MRQMIAIAWLFVGCSVREASFTPGDAASVDAASVDAVSHHALSVTVPALAHVVSAPTGIDCVGPQTCTAMFAAGTAVTVTATVDDAVVRGWTGDCAGLAASCTLALDADRAATLTVTPEWSFARSSDAGFAAVEAVAVGADGAVYVAGSFVGTLGLEPSSSCPAVTSAGRDGFLARLDASGACQWLRRWGSAGDDETSALAIAGDGSVTVAGAGTLNLLRFASDGDLRWSTGDPEFAHAIDVVIDPVSGDALTAGNAADGMIGLPGCPAVAGGGLWLARIAAATGQCVWARSERGSPAILRAGALGFDAGRAELIVAARGWNGSFTFLGESWVTTDPALLLGRLDLDGVPQQVELIGQGGMPTPQALAVDARSGNVIITGSFEGSFSIDNDGAGLTALFAGANPDMFVAVVSPMGLAIAQRAIANLGAGNVTTHAVAIAPDDRYWIVGTAPAAGLSFGGGLTVPPSTRSERCFVAWYADDLVPLGAADVAPGGGLARCRIDLDRASNVLLGATFNGTMDFGEGLLSSTGSASAAIARFRSPL